MENTYMKSMPERWGMVCRWIPSILIFSFLLLVGCQVEERNNALGEFRVNLTPNGETTSISKASGGDSVIPDAGDFQISIVSKDGTVSQEYEFFSAMPESLTLPVGDYEISAKYSRLGEEGFDAPTLGGSKTFSIKDGEVTSVDLVCTLTSTKVTVNIADEFVKYFPMYTIGIKSAKERLFYFTEETDQELFLQPGELYMEVIATKQNGTTGVFYPISETDTKAAEHYKINLTVNNGEVGGEKLVITFDDGVEEQEIEIDLSDESINAKEPFFTTRGFTPGQVFEIAEGTDLGDLSVLITARGGFQSCIIKSESAYLAAQGWESAIDLIGISTYDQNILKKFGLDWTPGLTSANTSKDLKMSEIFFSGLIPLLRTYGEDNEHRFTLVVTDQNSKKSEELEFVVRTKEANFVLHAPEAGIIGVSSAYFTVDLEDGDANQIVIQSKNDYGVWIDGETTLVSSEGNTYVVLAKLPIEDKSLLVRAKYNTIESNEQTLTLTVPKFEIAIADEADIWASKVYLTILPENPAHMEGIKKYLMVYVNSQSMPVSFDGDKAVVSGLTPGSSFTLKGSCDGVEFTSEVSSYAESALVIPNGDFEADWYEVYNKNIKQGGRYGRRGILGGSPSTWYQKDKDLVTFSPSGWITVNQKTMPSIAMNENTWYIVPSTEQTENSFRGSYATKLTNVAWDNNGVAIEDYSTSYLNGTPSRSENVPSSITNRSAGKLFLGDYSYDHSTNMEIYDEGIEFTSRPLSISGYYIFNDLGNDIGGTVTIMVENRENGTTVLGEGSAVLSAVDGYTYFNVPVVYDVKDKKATHLKVMFTSSTKSSYNQQEESNNIVTEHDIAEAVSTGSELYLDNIQLNYE